MGRAWLVWIVFLFVSAIQSDQQYKMIWMIFWSSATKILCQSLPKSNFSLAGHRESITINWIWPHFCSVWMRQNPAFTLYSSKMNTVQKSTLVLYSANKDVFVIQEQYKDIAFWVQVEIKQTYFVCTESGGCLWAKCFSFWETTLLIRRDKDSNHLRLSLFLW